MKIFFLRGGVFFLYLVGLRWLRVGFSLGFIVFFVCSSFGFCFRAFICWGGR